MSATQLQTPIVDGAIHSINFFNGRLLSARDLTLEQSAYREADLRLGKAVGEGVAYGLEVSQATKSNKQSPAVSVGPGDESASWPFTSTCKLIPGAEPK